MCIAWRGVALTPSRLATKRGSSMTHRFFTKGPGEYWGDANEVVTEVIGTDVVLPEISFSRWMDSWSFHILGSSSSSSLSLSFCLHFRSSSSLENRQNRLTMSRRCSSRYSCPRGWTGWPYNQYIYSNNVYPRGNSDSSSSSRTCAGDWCRFGSTIAGVRIHTSTNVTKNYINDAPYWSSCAVWWRTTTASRPTASSTRFRLTWCLLAMARCSSLVSQFHNSPKMRCYVHNPLHRLLLLQWSREGQKAEYRYWWTVVTGRNRTNDLAIASSPLCHMATSATFNASSVFSSIFSSSSTGNSIIFFRKPFGYPA